MPWICSFQRTYGPENYAQNCDQLFVWSSGKISGVDGCGRNFLREKCIEKSIEGQEKSAGTGIPALGVVMARCWLEDNFCRELQVERFSRADPRSAVEVANGVANRTVTVDGAGTRREIDAVE